MPRHPVDAVLRRLSPAQAQKHGIARVLAPTRETEASDFDAPDRLIGRETHAGTAQGSRSLHWAGFERRSQAQFLFRVRNASLLIQHASCHTRRSAAISRLAGVAAAQLLARVSHLARRWTGLSPGKVGHARWAYHPGKVGHEAGLQSINGTDIGLIHTHKSSVYRLNRRYLRRLIACMNLVTDSDV